MSTKIRKAVAQQEPDVAIEDDERHLDSVDDYIAKNAEALNDSIRHSRMQAAEGRVSKKSMSKIIAEGKARFAARKR